MGTRIDWNVKVFRCDGRQLTDGQRAAFELLPLRDGHTVERCSRRGLAIENCFCTGLQSAEENVKDELFDFVKKHPGVQVDVKYFYGLNRYADHSIIDCSGVTDYPGMDNN